MYSSLLGSSTAFNNVLVSGFYIVLVGLAVYSCCGLVLGTFIV